MQIASSPTRQKYPLSTKKIIKKTLSQCIAWIVLFVIISGSLLIGSLAATDINSTGRAALSGLAVASLALLLLIVALTYLYQRWYFAVYFYDLQDNYVVIRKGPITPREITIPYERLQDVYVDQDILDRILGLYDVHISSATASSAMEAHIDGVEREAADGLRSVILQTVSQKLHTAPTSTSPAPPANQVVQ